MKGFMAGMNHHDYRVVDLCRYCDSAFPLSYDLDRPHVEYAGLNLEDVFTQLEMDISPFA